MKILQNLSIKVKLITTIVGASLAIAVSGFLILFFQEIEQHKKKSVDDAFLRADLVGLYCVVPLTFGYEDEAQKALNNLSAIPSIEAAYVYDESDRVFATYGRIKDAQTFF